MKRALIMFLVVVAVRTLGAQDEGCKASPLQLSFWPGAQMMGKEVPIHGLKLNHFSGESDLVRGVDLGIISCVTDFRGLQVNAGNHVAGKSNGVQVGLVNGVKDFTGLAVGAVNYWEGGAMQGVTLGVANVTGEVVGVQIGIFNFCREMTGAQVGVVNIIEGKEMSFMPILNMAW